MSVTGNMFCFLVRQCVLKKSSSTGFGVFVTNLSMADFLMGVYVTIIGAADEWFRGRYLHYDEVWKGSVTCKMAGLLSLLSSEVSALIIWLITMDRFLVLRFPFSSWRFTRTQSSQTTEPNGSHMGPTWLTKRASLGLTQVGPTKIRNGVSK
ncbi:relaxin receptor 2-like [Babylonia areolata]|uniref:relaxin receptor 2-like n=1 Tax=Babylonia areolata TaxID=304850 RepID=UPI003FD42F49